MKHSTRQAKITLYIDVPTTDDENHFIGNNSVNAPSDIVISPIESDNLEEMIAKAKQYKQVQMIREGHGKYILKYQGRDVRGTRMSVKKKDGEYIIHDNHQY